MKKGLYILIILLLSFVRSYGQTNSYLRGDTIHLTNTTKTSVVLIDGKLRVLRATAGSGTDSVYSKGSDGYVHLIKVAASGSFINNARIPRQTANFNISGRGRADTLQAAVFSRLGTFYQLQGSKTITSDGGAPLMNFAAKDTSDNSNIDFQVVTKRFTVNGGPARYSASQDDSLNAHPLSLINRGYADARYLQLTGISATAPVLYDNTTGVISGRQATSSVSGYLSAADWVAFNAKAPPFVGTGYSKYASGTLSYVTSIPNSDLDNINLTSKVTGILPVANGGTGTATPGIVAGTNITVTGTWPNQTVNSTGGGGTYTANETPSGSVNSSNTSYTLAHAPVIGTVSVYLNGLYQVPSTDYTISSGTITYLSAPFTGDSLRVIYQY